MKCQLDMFVFALRRKAQRTLFRRAHPQRRAGSLSRLPQRLKDRVAEGERKAHVKPNRFMISWAQFHWVSPHDGPTP